MATILITYKRLDITEREAQNIIGENYPVVDAVEALSEGKAMEEGTIYHFNGMGSSALIPQLGGNGYPAQDPTGTTISLELRVSSHPDVSSVCYCNHIADPAKWEDASVRNRRVFKNRNTDTWNLGVIRADGINARRLTGKGIKIAILDTGIAHHNDLNVKGGVSFCEGITDFRSDPFGHGTHCAGIAAGRLEGIAKEADLFSIKVADTTGASPVAILAGMGWALENQMNIVSISLAGPADPALIPAFANAVQAVMGINCLVVASTGDSGGSVGFPANTPGVIAVGGCDRDCIVLDGTCIGGNGNHMTVVAPGQDIKTTGLRGDGYIRAFAGSSAAVPHVSGLIALIQQKFPGITPLQVVGRILASAQPVRVGPDQKDVYGGARLIDCDEALSLAQYTAPLNALAIHHVVHTAIEVTIESAAPTVPAHCAVTIINCDARHVDMKRHRVNGPTPARFTNVPPGRYYIIVSPEGWDAHHQQFIVIDGTLNVTSVTFDLSAIDPTGRITAIVLVGDHPAVGKTVTITGTEDKKDRSCMTDGKGFAVFNGLPETQQYRIFVYHDSVIKEDICPLDVCDECVKKFKFP